MLAESLDPVFAGEMALAMDLVEEFLDPYRQALRSYWPTNSDDGTPGEITMGHYIAHALILRKYMVYSEASIAKTGRKKSDLLAISEDRDHFIVVEIKTPTMRTVAAVLEDVKRAASFRLNSFAGKEHRVGAERMKTANNCQRGSGIVCILWDIMTRTPSDRNRDAINQVGELAASLGGWASKPTLFLNHTSGGGSYWFQYAVVPSWRKPGQIS